VFSVDKNPDSTEEKGGFHGIKDPFCAIPNVGEFT
jgi:hypothetical protein